MSQHKYDSPHETEDSDEWTAKLSGWWIAICIAICYSMPCLIVCTFVNEAGRYGTGTSGSLQSMLRIVAFFLGIGSAYYLLIRGTKMQKLVSAPAALGYTALVLGILWN